MSPRELFIGARMAMRLSRDCKREGEVLEAIRHRDRAAFYLKTRKMLMRDIHPQKMEQAA